MSVISFEENIYKLLTLKREAEKFYQTYSKDFLNIHYIKNLEEKSIQLKNTYLELQNTRQKSYEEIKRLEFDFVGQKEEKKLYQEKISELNQENDLLKKDLKLFEKEIKEKNKTTQNLSKELEEQTLNYKKELENLKLMHSQELFILKKKEKKK